LSRILIFIHPGSRIQKQKTKEKGERISCPTFFVATNITKLKIILFLSRKKKKLWANLQRILELFTPKNIIKLSIIWVWDPGSGKTLFQIQVPGSKGHRISYRIRIRNTDCNNTIFYFPDHDLYIVVSLGLSGELTCMR
jgi:hypothetical protein